MLLSSHIFEMISFNLQIKNLQRRYHFLVVLNKYARYSTFLANSSTQTCINLVSIGNKFHPKCWLNIRYCPFSSFYIYLQLWHNFSHMMEVLKSLPEKCGKVHFNAGRKVVHSFFKDLYHKKWTFNTKKMCNLRKNSSTCRVILGRV